MSNLTTLSADGSTTFIRTEGTEYLLCVEGGTWSGTLTPKFKKASGGTAVTYGSSTLTADGSIVLVVPKGCYLGATLSGSTGPSIPVHFLLIK